MKLFFGMMQRAGIKNDSKVPTEADQLAREEIENNYRPNRAHRRAMAKMHLSQRWDKKLAKLYGIPKAFRSHAKQYGSSTEMMLSELLQHGAITYKEMPEDGKASV